VGARADLVLWETERPAEVMTTMAPRRLVVKAGRLSIEHERICRELWRTGA
jgi:imidazolonepropionase-like amidohydrolase